MRPATTVGSAKGRSITALEQALAPEVVAHEHEGDGEAGDGVDDGHDGRRRQRQLERGHGLGLGDGAPKRRSTRR